MTATVAAWILGGIAAVSTPAAIAGWIVAYRRRGAQADAEIKLEATATALDGHIDANEIAQAELADRARIQSDQAATIRELIDGGNAVREGMAKLPAKCGNCGAAINTERDELMWDHLESVGFVEDPQFAADIKAGLEDVKAGRTITMDEFAEKHGLKEKP